METKICCMYITKEARLFWKSAKTSTSPKRNRPKKNPALSAVNRMSVFDSKNRRRLGTASIATSFETAKFSPIFFPAKYILVAVFSKISEVSAGLEPAAAFTGKPIQCGTFCRSFPAVILLRASRRTVRNHHTDCLCALEARKPLPSPEAAKHPSLKNSNQEHHRLRTLSFQSCPVDLLGFQERFDFEPAEQYRRVFSRSGLYSPDILPLDMIVEPVVGIALVQFPTCHHVRLRSITTAHGQSHEIGRFDQRILYISDVHRSINLQSKILLHSFYPAAPAGR